MEHEEIEIKPYTHKDLAALYDVSWRTLQFMLDPYLLDIGEKRGHYYTSKQVAIIFDRIGRPPRKGPANLRNVA